LNVPAFRYDGSVDKTRSIMDDLILEIQQKTNLSRDKVIEVVTIVTDFMKERLPIDVIETVSEYLGGAGERSVTLIESAGGMATGAARSATDVTGDATTKAVDTASAAFQNATETFSGVVISNDDKS
jgi:hypothetical protein